jgi:hypothetical protein
VYRHRAWVYRHRTWVYRHRAWVYHRRRSRVGCIRRSWERRHSASISTHWLHWIRA